MGTNVGLWKKPHHLKSVLGLGCGTCDDPQGKKEANWRPKIKPSCTWNIFWIFLSIYFFISRLNQWRREGSWDLPLHLITCFAFYTTWRVPIRSFLGQWCRDQLNCKFLWLHWIRLQYPHQDIFFLSQQQFGEVGTAVFTSIQSGSSGTSRQPVGFAPDWVILSCSVQSPAYLAASVPCASCLFPTHMLLCGVSIKKSNSVFPSVENTDFYKQDHCKQCLGDLMGVNDSLTS